MIEKSTNAKRILYQKLEFSGINGANFGKKIKMMFFKVDLPW